jgi:hypothetical protein
MSHEIHLLLRASGDYVPNTLPGEIWQNDVRLALVFGTVDDLGTLPNDWSPQAHTISRTETDWTITGNWNTNLGLNIFEPDDYLNDQAVPAWTDFMAAAHLSNQVRLRRLQLFPIGAPDGKAVPAVPFAVGTACDLEFTSSYPTGGESATQLPPQDSIVVSWKTHQIGARGRGRIFLPSGTSGSLSGAHVSSGAQSDIADAAKAFCEALAYSAGSTLGAHVRPIVTGAPFTQYGVITQVRVGSIMDTQRRRRNRLVETYVSENPSY